VVPGHFRNYSEQQNMLVNHQPFLMSQTYQNPLQLRHSMSIQQFQPFPANNQYVSTSSDLNSMSFLGKPLSINFNCPALSTSNSSDNFNVVSSRKKNSMREVQSHQKLRKNYSDHSNMDSSQNEIELECIRNAEDLRTCVMIKNIPNKYDQTTLLQEIDKNHGCRYDFFYLPIDFGNHANVGYAFVNFVHPLFILDFY